MAYTNRTCNNCGIRRPQPEMIKKQEVAVSASTNPKRKNSTRLYGRPKTVWYCKECNSARSNIGGVITFVVIAVVLGMIFF